VHASPKPDLKLLNILTILLILSILNFKRLATKIRSEFCLGEEGWVGKNVKGKEIGRQ